MGVPVFDLDGPLADLVFGLGRADDFVGGCSLARLRGASCLICVSSSFSS